MTVYQYKTNSVAAPFFSDPGEGFIEAESPMEALKKVVAEYKHPLGLFAAGIYSVEPKQKLLAEFLSKLAVAAEKAHEITKAGTLQDDGRFRVMITDKSPYYKETDTFLFEDKDGKFYYHWFTIDELATEDEWKDLGQ